MKRLIVAVIILVGVMFILTRIAEIEDILQTLEKGDWGYLGLALLVEVVWIVNLGATFNAIYRIVGLRENLPRLINLAMAANFVNIVAPSGGIGGMAVFLSDAKSREYSTGRATVASSLFVLLDYVGFFFILTLGFVVLIRRDQVSPTEIIASIILIFIALVIGFMLYLGSRSEKTLGDFLAFLAKLVNKITKPFRSKRKGEMLPPKRAYKFAHEIAEGVEEMRRNPIGLIYPILLAINGKVMMILLLFFIFLAFSVPVSIGTLIAGFCVAFLFTIVSPTPSGVGIVEGFLSLALSSFYIPLGTAAVLTMAYRGFTFWLPFFIGMFSIRGISDLTENEAEIN